MPDPVTAYEEATSSPQPGLAAHHSADPSLVHLQYTRADGWHRCALAIDKGQACRARETAQDVCENGASKGAASKRLVQKMDCSAMWGVSRR